MLMNIVIFFNNIITIKKAMNSNNTQEKIGVSAATIVGMNAMIGAGIFSVPAALGAYVGPAGIITYIFVIIAVWFMGSSMARLAQLYPEEGSFYTYASKWGGHVFGLIIAAAYLVGLIIAMGLLTQMAGNYVHVTFPQISAHTWGIIILCTLVIFNAIGVTLSKVGQLILICCTIFPLIATIIMCFASGRIANYHPFMPYGLTNVFAATKAVIFGFFGFECAASLFSIVENPQKNVPRALVYSIFLVGLLYLAFVASIIYAVPLEYLKNPYASVTELLSTVFPNYPWLLGIIHFSIISAIVGTVHSMIWSSGTLLVAYLKKFKNPAIKNLFTKNIVTNRTAILFIGLCIFITFSSIKNVNTFFALTDFFLIFAFTSSMITLLTLKTEWQSGQNIKTVLGLITAAIIFYFAFMELFLS